MAETVRVTRPVDNNAAELKVSELSGAIKRALEDSFGHVRLRGEISGFRGAHTSGHCYFGLKDEKAKIDAVIWRPVFQKLRVKPAEGLEVIVTGKVTSYPGSSKYQIVIESLEPAGVGALMAILEERKRQLAAEGLFAEDRKQPLPFLPRVVGIVTSPTGAVIRDMLHGFAERFPTRVVVWPVRVQGETSAAEVAAAINGFNALPAAGPLPRPDVIIVARGGGSLEDLWGFNDEIVVRAAAASRIPLISAVGHETDWTLIDLAADARAPTPTKAAEWAVPKHSELTERVADLALRLAIGARRTVEQAAAHLRGAARGLPRLQDLLALPRQRFDSVDRRLARGLSANTAAHAKRFARLSPRLQARLVGQLVDRRRQRLDTAARAGHAALSRLAGHRRTRFERTAGRHTPQALRVRIARGRERSGGLAEQLLKSMVQSIRNRRQALQGQVQMLHSLSYQSVIGRGYALLRDADGRTLRTAASLTPGLRIAIEVSDGQARATVDGAAVADPSPPVGSSGVDVQPPRTPARTLTPRSRGRSDGQGSLF